MGEGEGGLAATMAVMARGERYWTGAKVSNELKITFKEFAKEVLEEDERE